MSEAYLYPATTFEGARQGFESCTPLSRSKIDRFSPQSQRVNLRIVSQPERGRDTERTDRTRDSI